MAITLQKRYVKVSISDKNNANTKTFLNQNSIGARIEFSIIKYPQDGNNGLSVANISIYNLTDDTFKNIVENGVYISLTAGWQTNYLEIFNGVIMSIIRTREGSDIVTKLYCNVGGVSSKLNKIINSSYNQIALNKLLDSFSSYGFTVARSDFTEIIQNRSYTGSILEILSHLSVRYNFTFSCDGTTLKIEKNTEKNKTIFEFSPESGILKPPVITEKGADLEIFLNPTIRPNDIFKLNSKFATFNIGAMEFVERVKGSLINTQSTQFVSGVKGDRYVGTYKVIQLQHDGSTHTNTWSTKLDGIRWTI